MIAKYNYKLSDFSYILGVDLATYKTGISLYDISKKMFVEFIPLTIHKNSTNRNYDLYAELVHLFSRLSKQYEGKILVIKERCPQQNGKFTTSNTLQSLAGSHAVLDVALGCCSNPIAYDENGIHSTSIKTLFKSPICPQPQKDDIRKALVERYHLDDTLLTDDISDAIAVVHTLLVKKWNADIDDHIKEIKKEIKKLKAKNAISARQAEIERLLALKI